jgi:hypothetical protein
LLEDAPSPLHPLHQVGARLRPQHLLQATKFSALLVTVPGRDLVHVRDLLFVAVLLVGGVAPGGGHQILLVSLDFNDLHLEDEYARRGDFGGRTALSVAQLRRNITIEEIEIRVVSRCFAGTED